MIASGTSPVTGDAVGGTVSNGGLISNEGRPLVGVAVPGADGLAEDAPAAQAARTGTTRRSISKRRITGPSGSSAESATNVTTGPARRFPIDP
jgi:hypothetical protein